MLRVTVDDQVSCSPKKTINTVGQVSSDLPHPGDFGVRGHTGDFDTASLQVHHDEDVEGDQSRPSPDFNRGEVSRSTRVPVSIQEGSP